MSTTALRSIDCTETTPVLVSADHVHDLIAQVSRLERELRQRATTITTLRRELTRAIEAPSVVSEQIVDGMITVTLSTGAVLQRRPRVIDTPEAFEYGFQWMALEPIPGTPAQIVDSVFADDENVPEHYATAQETLIRSRLFGMAVTAGTES